MSAAVVGRNSAGGLYGLTAFCPILRGTQSGENRSHWSVVRDELVRLPTDECSFFAKVPNTYFARFYILRDVFYESKPAKREHLKSQYLVFTSNFHGDLRPYLWDMWDHAEETIRSIWAHCVAFDKVDGADAFVSYIERCQVDNTLLFNGSTDEPLAEQLKGLYLKQRFGEFVATHQGLAAADLRQAFREFLGTVQIDDLAHPTWQAGAGSLESVEV